jgi:hypothetical protein
VYVHLIRDLLRIPILCKGIFVVGAQFNMNKVCSWGLFPSFIHISKGTQLANYRNPNSKQKQNTNRNSTSTPIYVHVVMCVT